VSVRIDLRLHLRHGDVFRVDNNNVVIVVVRYFVGNFVHLRCSLFVRMNLSLTVFEIYVLEFVQMTIANDGCSSSNFL